MKSYSPYRRIIFLMLFLVILVSQDAFAQSRIMRYLGGGVGVDITILNPEALYSGDELIFDVALNTHSVSLDQYMMKELFYLRNERGMVFKSLAWESPKGGGHHYFGKLRFPGKDRNDRPIVLNDDKYIEVLIKGLGGIKESVLRWELPLYGKN